MLADMAKSTNALSFRCQPLVTVELQLPGDLFLSLCSLDRIQNQIDELIFCGLVIDNAIVIQISDDRQVQETLNGFDLRYICYPLLIGAISSKLSIQRIRISV